MPSEENRHRDYGTEEHLGRSAKDFAQAYGYVQSGKYIKDMGEELPRTPTPWWGGALASIAVLSLIACIVIGFVYSIKLATMGGLVVTLPLFIIVGVIELVYIIRRNKNSDHS
ncbi:hypothetical protein [Sciscionella marina]|uniref:hypothetical protein n=1 Tax=Sciscionella marina TaxID=508770 RepID=UPI0012F62FAF|nr:hypothetical protein [Sciscionella marina]